MQIRSITSDEIGRFAQLSNYPDRLTHLLEGFWSSGESRPEYCFVVEDAGDFLSGAIYITFPSTKGEFGLWDIFLPTGADWLAIGLQLLTESIVQLQKFGVELIGANVSSLDYDVDQRRRVFEVYGMELRQEKHRYEFSSESTLSPVMERLTYQSLNEFGEKPFIDLVERVTRSTLDREDQWKISHVGPQKFAEYYYTLLKDIDFRPDDWKVGLDTNGKVIGLIVPQQFSETLGALNYVGVIPERRGEGFGIELLHYGTTLLLKVGKQRIIGDIDALNHPLAKSLTTLGYKKESDLYCYGLELNRIKT